MTRRRLAERDPHTKRRWNLKTRYGLTPEQVDSMIADGCGICRRTNAQRWVVDHNHKTGVVRGVLCHRCNVLLGALEDEAFYEAARRWLAR